MRSFQMTREKLAQHKSTIKYGLLNEYVLFIAHPVEFGWRNDKVT